MRMTVRTAPLVAAFSAIFCAASVLGAEPMMRGEMTLGSGPLPLNMNLRGKVLPPHSDTQLVRCLMIGDSQMTPANARLFGAICKWDIDFVGRQIPFQLGSLSGFSYSGTEGSPYGGWIFGTTVLLGQSWGSGGGAGESHLTGRRISISGTVVSPSFGAVNEVARLVMTAGQYERPVDLDSLKVAKVAYWDTENQDANGGVPSFTLHGVRGSSVCFSGTESVAPQATGASAYSTVRILPAGELGSSGEWAGAVIAVTPDTYENHAIHAFGALIHNTEISYDGENIVYLLPEQGFIPFTFARSGWNAHNHNTITSDSAIDVAIEMVEGYDVVVVMLGHNSEPGFHQNNSVYATNLQFLKARINARHAALGREAPDWVFIAPWNVIGDSVSDRLVIQTQRLFEMCELTGDGFINLFHFYDNGVIPSGEIRTPRGTHTYTLDSGQAHPLDAHTAREIARDIFWHFLPENWVD